MRTASRSTRALLGGLIVALAVSLAASAVAAADSKPTFTGVVNVNTASPEQLQLLPGIGEARARAIVSMRKQNGGFKSLEQLTEVKGIGDAMLDRLRPHLSLNGKTSARKL
jgi:competence protein ComEA